MRLFRAIGLALGVIFILLGCVYRTREFIPADGKPEAEYLNWLIWPRVLAYEGSNRPGIKKLHRYGCSAILSLIPRNANNVPRHSGYEARLVRATLDVEGHQYTEENADTAYGGNKDSLALYLLRVADVPAEGGREPIFIPPGTYSIRMDIVVAFRSPKTGESRENTFSFKLKRHEKSVFLPVLLY